MESFKPKRLSSSNLDNFLSLSKSELIRACVDFEKIRLCLRRKSRLSYSCLPTGNVKSRTEPPICLQLYSALNACSLGLVISKLIVSLEYRSSYKSTTSLSCVDVYSLA